MKGTMGRPPIEVEEKCVAKVMVVLKASTHDSLRRKAAAEKRSMSAVVRDMVEAALEGQS